MNIVIAQSTLTGFMLALSRSAAWVFVCPPFGTRMVPVQVKLGFSYLRPLQIAFESPKFMLPIRLGTVNADGPQELYVFTLTRKGRVEPTNYRTINLPTGMDLPVFIKRTFRTPLEALDSILVIF